MVKEGKIRIFIGNGDEKKQLAVMTEGEFIGEMSLFEREARSATVRSLGESRILTVDKKNLLSNIKKDATLAFRIIETMSHRVRELSEEITIYKIKD